MDSPRQGSQIISFFFYLFKIYLQSIVICTIIRFDKGKNIKLTANNRIGKLSIDNTQPNNILNISIQT